jgi:hypothetical protein
MEINEQNNYKQCTRCMKTKPLSEFYTSKRFNKKLGHHIAHNSECKTCTKERARESQLRRGDEYKQYLKNWVSENESLHREMKKDWDERNKDKMEQVRKQWRQDNPNKIKEYNNDWKQRNYHDISKKERGSCKQYFDFSCAYCNLSEQEHVEMYGQQLHMDHVNPNGANDLSNNIPACKTCNSIKRNFPLEYFYSVQHVSDENKNKIYKWLSEDYKNFITVKKPRKPYTRKTV